MANIQGYCYIFTNTYPILHEYTIIETIYSKIIEIYNYVILHPNFHLLFDVKIVVLQQFMVVLLILKNDILTNIMIIIKENEISTKLRLSEQIYHETINDCKIVIDQFISSFE